MLDLEESSSSDEDHAFNDQARRLQDLIKRSGNPTKKRPKPRSSSSTPKTRIQSPGANSSERGDMEVFNSASTSRMTDCPARDHLPPGAVKGRSPVPKRTHYQPQTPCSSTVTVTTRYPKRERRRNERERAKRAEERRRCVCVSRVGRDLSFSSVCVRAQQGGRGVRWIFVGCFTRDASNETEQCT